MQNISKSLAMWAVVVAIMLLVPLISMQFAEEVNWSLFDFVLMSAILFGAALAAGGAAAYLFFTPPPQPDYKLETEVLAVVPVYDPVSGSAYLVSSFAF